MHLDLTITVSAILGISAVISPIATAIINNRYLLKLKKLEYEHQDKKESFFYKRGVYEDYLRYTGKCIAFATQENLQEYGKIYSLALIYFPEELVDDLKALNDTIHNSRWDVSSSLLNELAPKIRNKLQNM